MDWPLAYQSKGRPRCPRRGNLMLWTFASLALLSTFFQPLAAVAAADSSPPVADVEDLFKDEGFLRMSRGGEAFGRRPPPPPLILGPPHFSTQPPRAVFPTSPTKDRPKPVVTIPPRSSTDLGDKISSDNGGSPSRNEEGGNNKDQGSRPLPKDVNAVFSKVGGQQGGSGDPSSSSSGADSDAHPLLGITPAAPGEAFDFNPILSNPAVTRILAGSSGRIPQWEPTLPDLHDLIPEVNYTVDPGGTNTRANNGGNPFHTPKHHQPLPMAPTSPPFPVPAQGPTNSPKGPHYVPSPVSSNRSPTMYNMDQLTNNIAIPKHVLPNPSNLATSRSTVVDERTDGGDFHPGGNAADDRDGHQDRYSPNSNGQGNTLDEGHNGETPYAYEEEDSGLNEESKGFMGSSGGVEAQGKRGTWKGDGLEQSDGNGPKYIVCDALCGAWKHQCKLMGILFSITSVACLLLSLVVLHSLHFSIRDFAPFSVILLFLFMASASRSSLLFAGLFCSPDTESRPSWLPIISTLPSTFFVVVFLVALHLARFPFPFIKSYNTIPAYVILILSVGSIAVPLVLALGAFLYPPSQAPLTQGAWIAAQIMLVLVSLVYLFKFKAFYSKLTTERGSSGIANGNGPTTNPNGIPGVHVNPVTNGSCNLSTFKKRGYLVKWGCLQARAMFGAALLALTLSVMIIISVSMNRGECEKSSNWTGWVLSLCARMLEFAIVILLLVVTVFSVDIRFISRFTRVSINKTNVGLINGDIYPTMVSSNTAVQRCIPMYSSNARADVMMLGPTENRSSLRGKTFGERALPGERLGEYRASVGRGLPLRLGNGPSHSLPGTPVDGFPQGLKLPEPAPASLLVTKVVFGKPVSREVSHTHQQQQHQLENLRANSGSQKDDTNNIYASLESVKIVPFPNAGSSTGSNHSGSDRVLLSAPRDYIYSISRDLTKTIDSIYDARGNHLGHTIDTCPPLAHTIDQIASNGCHTGRVGQLNFHPHAMHHHNGSLTNGRTDLARTIERIRYAAATGPPSVPSNPPPNGPPHPHPGRNFVLQLGNTTPGSNHIPGMGNPPPYCSSESSHDVTPDSGIVSDIHSKSGRMETQENVYSRDYKRSSVEDVRRLPLLSLQKHRTPGQTPLYDRTPTSPKTHSAASTPSGAMHPSASPLYLANSPHPPVVGRVEHLLNQTEHILSRTESLDSNSHSAGLQRLLSHKEQLEHVERLLAQAEYAIWLEKKTAQQVSHHLPQNDPLSSPYGYAHAPNGLSPSSIPPGFPSANSITAPQCKKSPASHDGGNNTPASNGKATVHASKKISKNLEEESVV